MERFCKDLRDQGMKIIDHEKKEMIPLTNEEKESYEKQKVCHICKKEFSTDRNTIKLEIIVITRKNLEESHIIIAI